MWENLLKKIVLVRDINPVMAQNSSLSGVRWYAGGWGNFKSCYADVAWLQQDQELELYTDLFYAFLWKSSVSKLKA